MPPAEASTPARRVVVFGVDGVRYDTLRAARTPVLDGVAAAGFLAPVRVNGLNPTISGPNWATIATGVLSHQHGIVDNHLHGHRIADHPDFLARVRTARPAARTYAAAGWLPLVDGAHGGPIFLGGGYVPPGGDCGEDLVAWEEAEDAVTADAAAVLGRDDVTAAFVYLGAPDQYAHRLGVGPEYLASVESSDRRIGTVLAAIRARPSYAAEEWTVVVATDHGHVDAGGHGGDSVEERVAWIAASGPTVPGEAPERLEQADVAAHVLSTLDIPIEPGWELAGRPFDRRDRA